MLHQLPDFSSYCSPNVQLKGFEKLLEQINQQVANYARKSTLRLDICAPKRIFLCCPVPDCRKLKPYLVKGCFKNHLINKHNYSLEAAAEEVKNMECQEFLHQMQRDVESRKTSASCCDNSNSEETQSNTTNEYSAEELKHKPSELRSIFKGNISVINSTPQSMPLEQQLLKVGRKLYHVVVMDLETTGLNVKYNNSIIQIAFLSLATNQLHSIFVRPEPSTKWQNKATEMHQEKMNILAKSDFLRNVIPDVYNYLTCQGVADVIFLVHSTSLDEKFFTNAVSNICKVNFHYCHTMEKAMLGRDALEKQYSSLSDNPPGTPHNAAVDVVMLYDLLLKKFADDKSIVQAVEKKLQLRFKQTTLH
ncbi:hypothetical protein FDP41_008741 [Naegleria fowleri]|uniref:Exonuclease domain-containing protein n=1 Tax=Naegleria fowleri TaxID=5763 RepID=A0A6A5B5D2_NAEFO|nr:uncharacterized protein FDP41_008741 [Naegleria fowleri]KAF0973077.1 hypothetical protein FDP41_008741 [Naegleria fowleri]CAG4712876.1 unnamed protein product [Naegleria fowleri]